MSKKKPLFTAGEKVFLILKNPFDNEYSLYEVKILEVVINKSGIFYKSIDKKGDHYRGNSNSYGKTVSQAKAGVRRNIRNVASVERRRTFNKERKELDVFESSFKSA